MLINVVNHTLVKKKGVQIKTQLCKTDTRVMRGAYLERLVIKLKLKLRQIPEKAIFSLELGNRFSALTDNEEQDIVNQ